jgi:Ca2+-binding EF-hand superfamily protein
MFVNNEQGSADEKFDLIDTDNSGDISHKEFETLLRALVPTITEEEVQAATDEIDKNHDHKISREEFTKWYADSQLKLAATQAAIFAEVEVVFKEIDSDNSGTVRERTREREGGRAHR